jgi:hypothetical protein
MTHREIPSRNCEIAQAVEAGQMAMFRLAERDHGLRLKILELETGVPLGSLRSYATGTTMPVHVLLKLARVIPAHLVNLVTEPGGKVLDDAVIAALEMALKWAKARHPKSPSGVAIDHTERPDIELAAAAVQIAASKAAA